MQVIAALKGFFSVDRMLRQEERMGEIPTSREAYRDLWRIAWPSIIEMVFMSLIGSVDTVMVGDLGHEAVAAVGLTGQPRMLMMSIFFALNVGVVAIVARRKGQGLVKEARQTLQNALVLGMGIVIVMMVISIVFCRPLLLLVGANSDTIDMASSYFRIMAWFMPVKGLTICINGAQRGTGNTKITLYTNLVANIVNIIFDYMLIYGRCGFPALGVAGDAYASGIGLCAGLAVAVYSLYSKKNGDAFLRISIKDSWKPKKEIMQSLARVGGNAMVEQIALRVGFLTYAIIIGRFATEVQSAHHAVANFLSISFSFGDGLAVAGTALVGQMLGRQRQDLAMIYGKCSQRLAMIAGVTLAIFFFCFRYPFVALIIKTSDANNMPSYDIAVKLMIMLTLFQPLQVPSVVTAGCLRGAGDNLYVAMTMIICVTGVRIALASTAVFLLGLGVYGAWGASVIDTGIRLTLVLRRFTRGKWRDMKV